MRRLPWAPLLLVLAALAVHIPALDVPFLFDDRPGIVRNPLIRRLDWPWRLAAGPPFAPSQGRPLVALTLALNYAAGGLEVTGYHLVNLGLHVLNMLLLYTVLGRLLRTPVLAPPWGRAAGPLAFAAALLWGVHPVPGHTVAYVSDRTASLVAVFYLLGLCAVLRGAAAPRPALWGGVAAAAVAFGLAAKETILTLPLLAPPLLWLTGGLSFREFCRRRGLLLLGVAAPAVLLVPAFGLGLGAGKVGSPAGGVFLREAGNYALNQAGVLLHYLRLVFWPSPLLLDYGRPPPVTWRQVWPALLVLLFLGGGTLWLWRRRHPLALAGLFFFGLLLPTSSFLPVYGEVAALRRLYLASAVPIVLVVLGGWRLLGTGGRRFAPALLLLAVLPLALRTRAHHRACHDEVRLWAAAVREVPTNPRAHLNLGVAYFARGRLAAAERAFRQVLRLRPGQWQAWYDLGAVLARRGRLRSALGAYRRGLALAPRPFAHVAAGELLEAQGKPAAAEAHYRAALALAPGDLRAQEHLGRLLLGTGRPEEARGLLRQVLRRRPESVPALLGLTWILATVPPRAPDRARRLGERAAALTQHRDPWVLEALAAALAAGGHWEDAVHTAAAALARARAARREALAERIARSLAAYRRAAARKRPSGRPVRPVR